MKSLRVRKLSLFRKVALSLWEPVGDPSVYGFLEIDVTDFKKSSLMPQVIKALSRVMKVHKELNSLLRWGRLHYRQRINISVMVNSSKQGSHDLTLVTLEDVDQLSLEDIRGRLDQDSRRIRQGEDRHLGFALRLIRSLPWFLVRLFLKIYSLWVHDLNFKASALRLPNEPFGSVIVTNVGSLGIKKALVPLVPLSRAVMLISVGEVTLEPRVVAGKIEAREVMHLGVTFDHRFFDGSQAALMVGEFQSALEELGRSV